MKQTDVDFLWQDVVIGNEIDAIRYSAERKIHLLRNCSPGLHSYEMFANSNSSIEEVWAEHSYNLYESGFDPFTNTIQAIRVFPDDRLLKITTKGHKAYYVVYENLHLFNLTNVLGVENIFSRTHTVNRVLDWFDVRTIKGKQRKILTKDNFVNNIGFFKTLRIDGHTDYKDIVCESFLTDKQLKSPDYSDVMSKFKALHELRANGIPAAELTLWKREIIPLYKTNYKRANNISWKGIPDEEEYYKTKTARDFRE